MKTWSRKLAMGVLGVLVGGALIVLVCGAGFRVLAWSEMQGNSYDNRPCGTLNGKAPYLIDTGVGKELGRRGYVPAVSPEPHLSKPTRIDAGQMELVMWSYCPESEWAQTPAQLSEACDYLHTQSRTDSWGFIMTVKLALVECRTDLGRFRLEPPADVSLEHLIRDLPQVCALFTQANVYRLRSELAGEGLRLEGSSGTWYAH